MLKLRRFLDAMRRFAGFVLSLAVLGAGASASDAKNAGAPANSDQGDKYRYSFEYYRDKEHVFGRPGERLNPNDPRGHMSHGHGGGHL